MAVNQRTQHLIRVLSIATIVASVTYIGARTQIRRDVTAEGLSRITPETQALLDTVAKEHPVVVSAYVSKDVPRQYVGHRRRLLNLLREMEARGGNGLTVRIFEPEAHSEHAQQAADNYGITPRSVLNTEAGKVGSMDVFLGVAFSSGPREEIISFLDRGLSVEYELSRALRTVVQNEKRVVGILRNDVRMMGHFDLQSRSRQPEWQIVNELRKQYEVRSINPGADIPKDVDVLIVPQVSSLAQGHVDKVKTYIEAGRPALVVADPMPAFNVKLSPSEQMLPTQGGGGGMGGMFGGGGGQPAEPKGDYQSILSSIGVQWDDQRVVFDAENPNPRFDGTPPHIVFSTRRGGGQPFTGGSPLVDGLAQVVTIYGGALKPAPGSEAQFKPILTTSTNSGYHRFDEMVSRGNFLFGLQGPIPPRTAGVREGSHQVLAARVVTQGAGEASEKPTPDAENADGAKADEAAKAEADKGRNVIVLADLDMFSNTFFAYHERGGDLDGDGLIDIRFDNVTFLLNCIDTLAGDERFISLRRRQPVFRRLDEVDEKTREARLLREQNLASAAAEAEQQVQKAQEALDDKVAAIDARANLDATTKEIMREQVRAAEERRLRVKQEQIDREKAKKIRSIQIEHSKLVAEVQNLIRILAVALPPIPAILMGFYIYTRKRRRESSVIPASRKRGQS